MEEIVFEDFILDVHAKITEILAKRGEGPVDFGKARGLRSFLIDRHHDGVSVDEAARLAIDEFY